jgi:uncharacterized protein (TIGR02145 family)
MRFFTMRVRAVLLAVVAIFGAACLGNVFAQAAGTFKDARDGKTYKTVKMGEQTWMAHNLNYQPQTDNSWCYDNNDANCDKYGRLYDWEVAKVVCPVGWHLPTRAEWEELVKLVILDCSGRDIVGKKLKAINGWKRADDGTDDYGFSALPGGQRSSDGLFGGAVGNGYWWTATEYDSKSAYIRGLFNFNDRLAVGKSDMSNGASLRCLRD